MHSGGTAAARWDQGRTSGGLRIRQWWSIGETHAPRHTKERVLRTCERARARFRRAKSVAVWARVRAWAQRANTGQMLIGALTRMRELDRVRSAVGAPAGTGCARERQRTEAASLRYHTGSCSSHSPSLKKASIHREHQQVRGGGLGGRVIATCERNESAVGATRFAGEGRRSPLGALSLLFVAKACIRCEQCIACMCRAKSHIVVPLEGFTVTAWVPHACGTTRRHADGIIQEIGVNLSSGQVGPVVWVDPPPMGSPTG